MSGQPPPRADEGSKSASSSGSIWEDVALRRDVGILVGSQMMLNIGVAQVVPVFPLLATEMGLGAAGTGLLISAPAFARLAVNLPLGRLADTVGRKPLMRWGTLITAAGQFGTGLVMTSGLPAVLGMRLLIGAGSASSMSGSSAMMQDLTDRAPQHRAQLMAFQSFVLSGVWVAGPMLGGVLAEAYGVRNNFYLAGVGIGLCSLGYAQLPETLQLRQQRPGAGSSDGGVGGGGGATAPSPSLSERTLPVQRAIAAMLPLLRSSNVQALSALAASASLGQGCFMVVLTLHAREAWGASPADLGAMFSLTGISAVAGMPIGSWLAARTGRKALIIPGLVLSHISFACLAFVDTREAFYALLLLSSLSSAVIGPALGAFTAEVLPRTQRGQANAVSRTSGDIGSLMAPIALGILVRSTWRSNARVLKHATSACCDCPSLGASQARLCPLPQRVRSSIYECGPCSRAQADVTSCGAAIVTTSALCCGCVSLFALRAQEPPRARSQ